MYPPPATGTIRASVLTVWTNHPYNSKGASNYSSLVWNYNSCGGGHISPSSAKYRLQATVVKESMQHNNNIVRVERNSN